MPDPRCLLTIAELSSHHYLPHCSPQGYTCAGGKAKAACAADTANPYLGAGTSYCTNCKAATGDSPRTRPTSYAGAGYCTVPYLERNCPSAWHALPQGWLFGACIKASPWQGHHSC